ncbi:MAG TPA: hypothetical protein VHY91_14920 [Pirellulales bacterium]|nr:hypothetical protein [Pirellulales bacterium]
MATITRTPIPVLQSISAHPDDPLLDLHRASVAMTRHLRRWKYLFGESSLDESDVTCRQRIERFAEQAVPEFNRLAREYMRLKTYPCLTRLRAVHKLSAVELGESPRRWAPCYTEWLGHVMEDMCRPLLIALFAPVNKCWLWSLPWEVADGIFRAHGNGTVNWLTRVDLAKLEVLLLQEFDGALNSNPRSVAPRDAGNRKRRPPKGTPGRKPAVEKHAAVFRDVESGMTRPQAAAKYGYSGVSGVARAIAAHQKRQKRDGKMSS